MIELSLKQTGWIVALLLVLATIYLYRLSKGRKYAKFDIIDLITNREGRIDQSKLHMEGAFLVSTYGFLYLLWEDKLTEWFMTAYLAAWLTSGAYSLKKRMEGPGFAPPKENS